MRIYKQIQTVYLALLLLIVCAVSVNGQQLTTIAEAKPLIGSRVKVAGVVTSDRVLDNRLRYFQDNTAGMVVFQTGNEIIQSLELGDSIIVTGTLIEFSGLAEISTPNLVIEIIARGKPVPAPKVILATEMREENESRLVMFEDVTFERAGGVFSFGNYNFFDKEGNRGELRLGSNAHPLIGKDIPAGKSTLIGVLSQFNAIYQLLPRDQKDLIVGFSVSDFVQTEIQNRSASFTWSTNKRGSTGLRYREVDTQDFDTVYTAGANNNHRMSIGGLRPATFYEVQSFSYADTDTTASGFFTIGTRSESSGDIKAYFNFPLMESAPEGIYLNRTFADTIAAYIDRASTSIEVAVYNSNAGSQKIMQALNNAQARGLRVRYIADAGQANAGLTLLNGAIPVLRVSTPGGIMHNKFVVIDAGSRNHSFVISSSANFTSNGLNDDPNNLIIIQDQALAKAHQREFEEMWGGSGNTPNLANVKTGNTKSRNTPTQYMVGGKKVELYFSPTDGTTGAIINNLEKVQSDVRFSLLLLTRSDISNQITKLHTNGWSVKGIIHDTTDVLGSQFRFMKEAGVDVHLYARSGRPGQFHHKYAIVDALNEQADPTVLTGSHNWSTAAESTNDENLIVIHDAYIANLFLMEFRQRYLEVTGTVDDVLTLVPDAKGQQVSVYPNPTKGRLYLKTENQGSVQVQITDMFGRLVYATQVENRGESTLEIADLSTYQNGMYLVSLIQNGKKSISRIVVNK